MKKRLQEGLLFLFGFGLLLCAFALPLFAQDTPATTSADIQAVDYTLPYPGLLPDNPLYVVKTVRDRIIGFFISDPKEKAAFDLLQADKRVSAAFTLSQEAQNQQQLIVDTVSKGENYFAEAIAQAHIARQEGIEINGLLDQLENASKKHQEVIIGIKSRLSSNDSEQLTSELKRLSGFTNQVKKLRSLQ